MITKEALNHFNFVGISGLANSGKDLFFDLCRERLSQKKMSSCGLAIAKELKKECNPAIKKIYGFSLCKCDRNQKDSARDALVFYGTLKREESKGRHWINKAERNIQAMYLNSLNCDYRKPTLFVTDVRYSEYRRDEVYWIKKELNGTLVHVRRYETEPELDKYGLPTGNLNKIYHQPPNSSEQKNDPKLQKAADYLVEWPTQHGGLKKTKEKLFPVVDEFLENFIL